MPSDDYTLSPGGQKIYRHKPREDEGIIVPEESCKYLEDIERHLDKVFGKRENFVYHEIVSDIVHIDVIVLMPTDDDRRTILFTSGMSDLPMTLPPELLPQYKHLERAELALFLPAEWDIKCDEEIWYWPIRLIKTLARLPHDYKTWLGYGHSVPNGAGNEPYADNTKLCGSILYAFDFRENTIKASDGTAIQVYNIIPVYKQEMEYKLRHSADKLLEKLVRAGISTTVNIKRRNVCTLF